MLMYFFSPFTKLKTALHRLDHFDMTSVYYNELLPFILYHGKIQSVPVEINRYKHSCYEYCLKNHDFVTCNNQDIFCYNEYIWKFDVSNQFQTILYSISGNFVMLVLLE